LTIQRAACVTREHLACVPSPSAIVEVKYRDWGLDRGGIHARRGSGRYERGDCGQAGWRTPFRVLISVIDPVISTLVNHSAKAPVEEAIIESGMEYALLQPTLFVQGVARSWPTGVTTGIFEDNGEVQASPMTQTFDWYDKRGLLGIALILGRAEDSEGLSRGARRNTSPKSQ
jgi:hypothetical protein